MFKWGLILIVELVFFSGINKLKPIFYKELKTLMHVVISPSIDYSNALFFSLSESAFDHLHAIKNARAGVLNRTNRQYYITPLFISLHRAPSCIQDII